MCTVDRIDCLHAESHRARRRGSVCRVAFRTTCCIAGGRNVLVNTTVVVPVDRIPNEMRIIWRGSCKAICIRSPRDGAAVPHNRIGPCGGGGRTELRARDSDGSITSGGAVLSVATRLSAGVRCSTTTSTDSDADTRSRSKLSLRVGLCTLAACATVSSTARIGSPITSNSPCGSCSCCIYISSCSATRSTAGTSAGRTGSVGSPPLPTVCNNRWTELTQRTVTTGGRVLAVTSPAHLPAKSRSAPTARTAHGHRH